MLQIQNTVTFHFAQHN